MSRALLAIDPGRDKCGAAVLASDGTVLMQEIVPTQSFVSKMDRLLRMYDPIVIMGNGTTSAEAKARLEGLGYGVILVDEYRTTDAAKRLYWETHPPRGWRRLVPRGMLVPPVPVDDYAAVILARRFLAGDRVSSRMALSD